LITSNKSSFYESSPILRKPLDVSAERENGEDGHRPKADEVPNEAGKAVPELFGTAFQYGDI
jgi:hypothetical protein